jgi:hypothetical protein
MFRLSGPVLAGYEKAGFWSRVMYFPRVWMKEKGMRLWTVDTKKKRSNGFSNGPGV